MGIEVKSFIIQEVQLPRETWGRMQEAAQKEAETTKASIEIATSAISSETSKIVAKMKAEQDRNVAEKLNSAELIEADLKAQADAVKREVQTKLQAALNNITAEGKEFQVEKETQLAAQVAQDKATSAELV